MACYSGDAFLERPPRLSDLGLAKVEGDRSKGRAHDATGR
jgi:hypothetical protein